MSSSTALLPKAGKKDDHPIFLRVCHSPWVSISQKGLSAIRGLIAFYMLAAFILCVRYDKHYLRSGWLIFFDAAYFAYALQLIYAWISFVWTLMHLYYPHHASQPQSATTSFQKLLSPPRTHFDTHNRDFFSIFYTAAVVLPHVITLVFWAVLIPEKHADYPVSELFTHGWYRGFWVLNKYAINSLLALVEVVALSSIRRQTPVWAHIFALVVLANLYVGWVYIGHKILHRYAYFFFDHAMIGWEFVSAAIIGASFLPIVFFAFVYGITGLREVITKKRESTSYGYSRLPQ